MAGIEPATATLAGRARYLSRHPQMPTGWRLRALLGAHAVELTRCDHIPPKGGDPQGRQESNPHSARVGTGPPIRWLIPKKLKTAPSGGFPGGGCQLLYPLLSRSLPAGAPITQGSQGPREQARVHAFVSLTD